MKYLITGAAGFIGSHLFKKLIDEKKSVIGIDNFSHASKNPIITEVQYADIRYYNDVEPLVEWADVVYHLAAQIHVDKSILNPQETIDVNVTGTLNVLEAVRKHHKKMVFASSSEVYGTSQTGAMSEDHPLDAQSPYAAAKVAGDRLCKSYADTYGTQVAILRNFNAFGEYQNDSSYGGVIAIFTRRALSNQQLEIYGDGNQQRDYMHVRDAIRGYELLSEQEYWGKPVNIGTGETISINELAEAIIRITGSKSEIVHVRPRAGEVMKLCADITKAKQLGFVPSTDLEKDLTTYIQFYANTILKNVH